MDKIRNRLDTVNHNDPNWAKHRHKIELKRKAGRKASKLKWKVASKYEAKRVWRTYAMTIDDICAMHKAQGGRCANPGCREIIQALGRSRAVDHCHKTGKVRGMLCKACNLGLGLFADSPRRLVGILAYLGYIDAKLLK